MSARLPFISKLQKYSSDTWLSKLHMLQDTLRPPSVNVKNGLMYALHRLHLMGPLGPQSTKGMGFSSGDNSASG